MADATGHLSSPDHPPGAPAHIGRFQVRGTLGAGASGTVYRAHDPRLARDVALKLAHPGTLQTPAQVSRFLREARAAGGLRHPHIVPVYDAGRAGDAYYLAAAFIEGPTLARCLDEDRLALKQKAAIVREVAEALGYAHHKGIVHRDVKPSNILLDRQDRAYLTDFGLARKEQSQSKLTQDGELLGTPAYMAPEQAENSGGEARAASDQYSLGVVLYECLCGQRPFSGPAVSLLYHILHSDPPPPRGVSRGVPRDLERICLKAMARRPEDRYPDCQELADELRRWLDGEPDRARPLGLAERFARWLKREPVLASAVGVSLLALLALLLVPLVSAVMLAAAVNRQERAARGLEDAVEKAEQAAADADAEQQRARDALREVGQATRTLEQETGQAHRARADAEAAAERSLRARAEVEARKGQRLPLQYAADILLVAEDMRAGRDATARLNAQRPAAGKPDLRGFEWWLLADRTRSLAGILALAMSENWVPEALLAPTRDDLVVTSLRKLCRLPWKDLGKPWVPDWLDLPDALGGPDMRFRALSRGDTLLEVHDNTSGKAVKLQGFGARASSLSFSANGKRLASFHAELLDHECLWLWDLATGQRVQRYLSDNKRPALLSLSPAGVVIATVQPNSGEIRLWSEASPKAPTVVQAHASPILQLNFSPDGSLLATASKNEVKLWDVAAAKERVLLGKDFRSPQLRFSTNGKKLLLMQEHETEPLQLWDAAANKRLFSLDNLKPDIRAVALSDDGSLLAALTPDGDMLRLCNADTGQSVAASFLEREGAAAVAFSPDARQLVILFGYGELQVLDRQHLRPSPLSNPGPAIESLAFDAKNMRITASTPGGGILAWDVASGSPRPGDAKERKADPQWRAVARPTGVDVVEVSSGKTRLTLATAAVSCLSWSPDGKTLACGHDGGKLTLWDGESGKLRFEALSTHQGAVRSLACSPDGRTIVSGGADGHVRLWQTATGQELLVLEPRIGAVQVLAFNGDGTILAAGGSDGRVRLWHAPRDPVPPARP